MKKTILHIIHDLGRGGAETMLVNAVNELSGYNNIVVTLFDKNHFADELKCDKYFCLGLKSLRQLPFAVAKLKKLIKNNDVDIVHSHLFWPTVLARVATPKKIPLVTTIHAFIATSMEYNNWRIRLLDKLTYRVRKNIIIGVAKGATKEYFSFLKLTPYKAYTLYTFVDTRIFSQAKIHLKNSEDPVFKLITVGALRKQKNQQFLLDVFKHLDKKEFQLDIYGDGELDNQLRTFIKDNDLNVNLKGAVKNLPDLISNYDLFVMSSNFEGFALSVLEAMAMQMPLLLSDIASFKEQCENAAAYFQLESKQDFIIKLRQLADNRNRLRTLGNMAKERVLANFTLTHHMAALNDIYLEIQNQK